MVSSAGVADVGRPRAAAKVTRALRGAGQLIGTNDLWIACTAGAAGIPVIARDADHFARVPGLEVVRYGDA